MNKNIFLDTNILVDLLDRRRKNHHFAVKLLEFLIENEWEIYISEDMVSTLYYLIKDKKRVLKFLKEIAEDWHIVPFGREVILEAIHLAMENGEDLEDLLQCLSAKRFGCILMTNDKSFTECGVQIVGYEWMEEI